MVIVIILADKTLIVKSFYPPFSIGMERRRHHNPQISIGKSNNLASKRVIVAGACRHSEGRGERSLPHVRFGIASKRQSETVRGHDSHLRNLAGIQAQKRRTVENGTRHKCLLIVFNADYHAITPLKIAKPLPNDLRVGRVGKINNRRGHSTAISTIHNNGNI